jgi:uncharacterized protein
MAATFLTPLLRARGSELEIRNGRTGRLVASRILAAFDSADRRRGLLGRDRLDPGQVMILAPSNAVHTWFMRFPLDIAFVTRDGRIVKLRSGVRPWRMAASLTAYAVVEAAAGAFEASGTGVGDTLIIGPAGEDFLFRGR